MGVWVAVKVAVAVVEGAADVLGTPEMDAAVETLGWAELETAAETV